MTTSLDAYAGLIDGYLSGPREYVLEAEYATEVDKASAYETELVFEEGGKATYSFYVPFDFESVSFNSRYDLSGLSIVLDGTNLEITQKTGETQTAVLPKEMRMGEYTISISSKKSVTINKIVFNKARFPLSEENQDSLIEVNLSEEEKLIQSAVILRTDASMILVNGGRRYIDNSNVTLKPLVVDGTTYIPLHTFARAFSCYYEEIPEKKYVLLRKKETEFLFSEDICYKYVFDEEKELIDNKIKYVGNTAYVPLRFFAESFGEVIGYKNGMIVADDNRYYIQNVLDDEEMYRYVDDKFDAFKEPAKLGKTYHVAKTSNASDDNPGTEQKPFKTLNKAGSVVKAGDTVIVHDGVYRETLVVKADGTATSPIVFKAAEGEKPIISAAEEINTFVDYGENMVCAVIPWDLGDGRNQIFYNGTSVREAVYPNNPTTEEYHEMTRPLSDNWFVFGDIQVDTNDFLKATSKTLLDQEDNYWKGAYFRTISGNCYTVNTARVSASTKGSLTLEDPSINYWVTGRFDVYNYGCIVGHINCIDLPGEWVIKNGYLFMIPPEGETAKTLKLDVKKRQLVADLANNKYIQIKGIDTIGGSIKMNESEMCMIDGCEIKYNNHFILSKDQHSGFIDDANTKDPNGAPPRGEVGIYVGGKDNIFINNNFNQAAGAALYVVGLYMYAENNIVDSCGYAGSYVTGINVTGEGWKDKATPRGGHAVYHNTLFNSGRSPWHVTRPNGFGMWPFVPYEFAYNDVHDGMLNSLDTGIVYTYFVDHGTDRQKTLMHNNYIYYTQKKPNSFSFGIYHDGSTHSIDTYENVTFTTEENVKFTREDGRVYLQHAEHAKAVCDIWNNTTPGVIIGGPEALKEDHFPNGMPFYAGALQGQEAYMLNYNNRHNSVDDAFMKVENAELGEGVTLQDGKAVFTKDGQWVKFKDVDFSDGKNAVMLLFTGNKYESGDTVELMIDSLDSPTPYVFTSLKNLAATEDDMNSEFVQIRNVEGVHDVYIRMRKYKSIAIEGIKSFKYIYGAPKMAERGNNFFYAGTFDDYIVGDPELPPKVNFGALGDKDNPYVNNTWAGTVLVYDGIVVDKECTNVTLTWASSATYGGQPCQIRIEVPHARPIAVVNAPMDGWDKYVDVTAELEKPLAPGVYTVYLTFDDEDTSKTSNLYKVKFD